MCYEPDYFFDVQRTTLRKARKAHRCSGCGHAIQPGEQYFDGFGVSSEGVETWNKCEGCHYHLALIYAEEIAEGCMPYEAHYPLDAVHQEMGDRGWYVPGRMHASFEPKTDDESWVDGVVRFGEWRKAAA